MRILWLTNLPLPYPSEALQLYKIISGSWLSAMANILQKFDDVELFVLSPAINITFQKKIVKESKNVTHIIFNSKQDNKEFFKEIIQEIQPDVVNIHGTEYKHALDMAQVSDPRRTVVSLQGIVITVAECYQMGLDKEYDSIGWWHKLLQKRFTTQSVKQQQDSFYKSAKAEAQTLNIVKYVIGRTQWDKDTALNINPNLKYFKVNESLRNEFYTGEEWSYNKCEKHSLFFSQVVYPIKGFHQFLKIAPKLKEKYPDLKIYVGGPEPFFKKFSLRNVVYDLACDYRRFLKKLAKENNINDCIVFTSNLNSYEMKEHYLSCNAFISCSSIENESNSVGEAKILAVPVVASLVGGVVSRVENNVDALGYNFYDTDALYNNICKLFDDPDFATQIGLKAKENVLKICDKEVNAKAIYNTYKEIIDLACV